MRKVRNQNRNRHLLALLLALAGLASGIVMSFGFHTAAASFEQPGAHARSEDPVFVEPATSGGIIEAIPEKYREKYQEWKKEFLSTETGRSQWEKYAHNTRLLLTITVSRDNQSGAAATGKYKWDDSGVLIAATITLGCRIDEGYPSVYPYPATNSLKTLGSSPVNSTILAATKMAHEFGHVNRMTVTDAALYRLQNQLVPVYYSIFQVNGHNARDPRLTELARQMGGSPEEVWGDREYWAEANATLYIRDKIAKKLLPCSLLTRIKQNVELYAKSYEERFVQMSESKSTLAPCASQKLPRLVAQR